mmetsp:Transcript_72820/g.116157  ORF Transcript_72820/g.116157 Transcript_72820/m.116157 type:complete len:85 (-) Transcript_72820:478-732(-)
MFLIDPEDERHANEHDEERVHDGVAQARIERDSEESAEDAESERDIGETGKHHQSADGECEVDGSFGCAHFAVLDDVFAEIDFA